MKNELITSDSIVNFSSCQEGKIDLVWDLWLNVEKLPLFSYNSMIDIEGFALWMFQRGLKKNTIKFYIQNAKRINLVLGELTLDSVNSFLLKLLKENKSSSYINDHVITIKQYAKWKNLDDFKQLKFIKENPTIKSTMSDSEIEAFLKLPPPTVKHMFHGKMHEYIFKPEKYYMWTLFFKILAYSGMRCGEVANLTIDQIDFGRGIFTLHDTKTNTPRNVPIASTLIDDLTEYVKTCNNVIFSGKSGKPPPDSDWGRRFHDRLTRLGIKRVKLTPYSFRHSFATRLLSADNVNVFQVQKILGHRNLKTTQIYTHLTTVDIIKTIKNDPLSRQSLPFYDRLKAFRDGVRLLLTSYALSPDEEKEMLKSL